MSWQQRAFAAVVLFCFVAYILLYSGVVLPDESAAEISQEQQLMRAQHERQRTGKLWLHQQHMAETPGCLGAWVPGCLGAWVPPPSPPPPPGQCASLASSQFPPAAPSDPSLDAHSCREPWNYVFSFPRGERCGYGYDAVLYESIIAASPATCATFIDIGANWGQSTMPLLSKGWRVIAFEPVPTTASNAAFNLAQNDIPAARGVVVAAAASNQSGWSTIYLPTTRDDNAALSSASATKNVGGSVQATRIRTIRLDDYLGSMLGADSVKAIKIDAQGHELEVLHGMGKLLRTMDVTLIVENDAALQRASGKKDVDVRNYLESHGYFANCLRAKSLVPSPPGFPDCYDVIYRRNAASPLHSSSQLMAETPNPRRRLGM